MLISVVHCAARFARIFRHFALIGKVFPLSFLEKVFTKRSSFVILESVLNSFEAQIVDRDVLIFAALIFTAIEMQNEW